MLDCNLVICPVANSLPSFYKGNPLLIDHDTPQLLWNPQESMHYKSYGEQMVDSQHHPFVRPSFPWYFYLCFIVNKRIKLGKMLTIPGQALLDQIIIFTDNEDIDCSKQIKSISSKVYMQILYFIHFYLYLTYL